MAILFVMSQRRGRWKLSKCLIYEDFGWSDRINGPLKNVMPCSYHLEDDFDATMIAKMIEIAKSGSLWAQLESADWYDD